MSLIQKSSNFALVTCSNCTSPVFPCGIKIYSLHLYYKGSFGLNWKMWRFWRPLSNRRLRPLRRAYWLTHDVFQVKKMFFRTRQSFCVQFTSQILTPYPWENGWPHLKQYHRSQITNLYHIYIIIGVRAKSASFGYCRLFANFGGFARPFATYERSLNQKSSKFALGTCSNCTSPVSPCGVYK